MTDSLVEIDRQIAVLLARRAELAGPLPDVCPGSGACHGSLGWCDKCGNVNKTCDDPCCDTHYPTDPFGDKPRTPDRYYGQE